MGERMRYVTDDEELVCDNFAGSGGVTEGIEQAIGRPVDIAINHSQHALETHAANHPETIHLCNDIFAVDPSVVCQREVGFAWFSPDCFPAGTYVLTRTGLRPIEKIRKGDLVMTHRNRWRVVESTLRHNAETVSVRGYGHYGLVTTPKHQFYSKTITRRYPGKRTKGSKRAGVLRELVENVSWPEARRMEGRLWATPRVFPESEIPTCSGAEFSEDFFYFVGRWLGDGSVNKGDADICCGLSECEEFSARMTTRPLRRADGQEMTFRLVDHGSSKLFVWGNQKLVDWLATHFGKGCDGKTLPIWCLSMQANWRRALLQGYVDADGHCSVRVETKSISKPLTLGIRLIAVSLGFAAALYKQVGEPGEIEGRKFQGQDCYRTAWREQLKTETVMWDKAHLFQPVREVTPAGRQTVYSLQVAEDESFVADGIVVHNCRHHSRARGSAPISESVRDLAWIVTRWARKVRPRVIGFENVREFMSWGPVIDYSRCKDCRWEGNPRWKKCRECGKRDIEIISRPCPERAGETFRRWRRSLINMGYDVEFQILNAADYGAPTSRKRLFMVARCDGEPIVWPKPTHGKGEGLLPYRTAAECIHWDIPVRSIFDRKRPLADKTMRRIAMGIKRYVLDSGKPFIVPVTHGGDDRVHSLDDPLRTVTTAQRGEFAFVAPSLVGVGGRRGQSPPASVEKPMPTMTTKGDAAVVAPTLVRCAHGDGKGKTARRGRPAHDIEEPIPTVTGSNDFALASAHLMKFRGDSAGGDLQEPMPTVTSGHGAERPAGAAHAMGLSVATLVQTGYGEAPAMFEHRCSGKPVYAKTNRKCRKCGKKPRAKKAQAPRTLDIEKPLGAVVSSGKHAMCAAFIAKYFGDTGQRPGSEMDEPVSTITTQDHNALVAANLLHLNNNTNPSSPEEPLHSVTAGGNHAALAAANLIRMNHGDKQWHSVEEPLPVVTSQGNKAGLVYAFLTKFFGTAIGVQVDAPTPTVTTKDRFGLVTVEIDGELYVIVDIGMRMLEPEELATAQGFPANYVFLGPKCRKVAHIGNAVCPPVARAIVASNFRPRKVKTVKTA